MRHLMPSKESENNHILVALLSLSGDTHLMLAHNVEKSSEYHAQYHQLAEHDTVIQASTDQDLPEFGKEMIYTLTQGKYCFVI